MARARQPEMSELINAIKNRKVPTLNRVDSSAFAREAVRRRNMARSVKPIFENAGIDVDKLNTILSRGQADLRRSAEKMPVRTKKAFGYLERVFQQSIKNKRKALEQLATAGRTTGPTYVTSYYAVDTPFLIDARSEGIITEQHTEAWNSWAKILFDLETEDRLSDEEELSFYFFWTNPNSFQVVVTVDAYLICKGYVSAWANTGFLSGGNVTLQIAALLSVYQPPATQIGVQSQLLLYALPYGGSQVFGGTEEQGPWYFFNGFDLQYNSLAIPAYGSAVFQVTVDSIASISGGGRVKVDFARDDLDYYILCPFIQLSVNHGGGGGTNLAA